MLCKSISYPPPPDSDAYRVSVSAVPGRSTALPRPSRTHRRPSTHSSVPLIRGSNLRLPEHPAGRCSPDTRAFVQPLTPRVASPVAGGSRAPGTGICIFTARPNVYPFQRAFISRAPAALPLQLSIGDAGSGRRPVSIRTGCRTGPPAFFGSTSGERPCSFTPTPSAECQPKRYATAVGRVEPQGPHSNTITTGQG